MRHVQGSMTHWDKVERVKTLREKGLSFRKIASELQSDVKTVYRWSTYNQQDAH